MAGNETLSDYVAGEIRASLARQRTSGRELAEKLGVSRSWISYRLTGATEITLNDLQRIAAVLNVEVADLLPTPARRGDRGEGGMMTQSSHAARMAATTRHPADVRADTPDTTQPTGRPRTSRDRRTRRAIWRDAGVTA